jgi:hypothetical protein
MSNKHSELPLTSAFFNWCAAEAKAAVASEKRVADLLVVGGHKGSVPASRLLEASLAVWLDEDGGDPRDPATWSCRTVLLAVLLGSSLVEEHNAKKPH